MVATETKEEHEVLLKTVLEKLVSAGVRLNEEKCAIFKSAVSFLGYTWSARGVKVEDDPVNKLLSLAQPKSRDELRSFLGLASYLGTANVPHYSTIADPLWKRCSQDSWNWDAQATEEWMRLRNAINSIKVRTLYNPNDNVVVQSDASPVGLGAVLLQGGKPILFASRKLTSAEKNYSQIEKEAVGALYAMKRFRMFLLGRTFTMQTDHQPLLALWKKSPDEISARLKSFFLDMYPFSFEWDYLKGKENVLADALSRLDSDKNDLEISDDKEDRFVFNLMTPAIDLNQVARASSLDKELVGVRRMLEQGIHLKEYPYWNGMKEQLTVQVCGDEFVVLKGDLVIIPKAMRNTVLGLAHDTHMGISKMKSLLRVTAYWPGMSKEIGEFVRRCDICLKNSDQGCKSKMTAVADEIKEPGEVIAVDIVGPSPLFDGNVALTTIDLYSRYPTATVLKHASGENVAAALRQIFSMFGAPCRLISDNGTCFRSHEVEALLKRYGVVHSFSSIYYPQANGVVERMHRTMKTRLRKTREDNPQIPLLVVLPEVMMDMRATPNEATGETPFYRLCGREMRNKLSSIKQPARVDMAKRSNAARYAQRQGRQSRYQMGDKVWMRKGKNDLFSHPAVIKYAINNGSYKVMLENGNQRVVNQYHLQPRMGVQ
jgi:hypothetical protein